MKLDAQEALEQELRDGESLLWAAQPRQGLVLRGIDWFLIPFGLFWNAFILFSLIVAMLPRPDSEDAVVSRVVVGLFLLPFVAIGLYFFPGRLFVDAKLRKSRAYGVTDRRIVILEGVFSRSVTSLALNTLNNVVVRQKRNGDGSITFGLRSMYEAFYTGFWWPGVETTPAFELIENVREVEGVIQTAQSRAQGAR